MAIGRLSLLLFDNAHFDSLVVHIQVTHWLFLHPAGYPTEARNKCLIVNLEFTFHTLLFIVEFGKRLTIKLGALNSLVIESKFADGLLILLLSFYL